jgi:SAM-dependent methyltransferase
MDIKYVGTMERRERVMPEATLRTATPCPCCSELESLSLLGPQGSGDGRLLAAVCSACGAIVNISLLASGKDASRIVAAWSDRTNAFLELDKRSFDLEIETERQKIEDILRSARPAQTERFCDFGCGNACAAAAATELFDEVHAVDLSLINARVTAAFARDCGRRPFNLHNTLETTPGGFDLIIARQVLQHSTDAPGVVTNLMNKLRSGGVLALELPTFVASQLNVATAFLPSLEGFSPTLSGRGLGIQTRWLGAASRVEQIFMRVLEKDAER